MLTRESLKPLAAAVAIIFTLFQIWFTAFGVLEGTTMRADFLGFVMVLIFLLHPPFKMKEGRKEPAALIVLDLCLSVLAVVIAAYITINSAEIMERMRYVDDVSATGRLLAAAALLLTNPPPHHRLASGHHRSDISGLCLLGRHAALGPQAHAHHDGHDPGMHVPVQ